MDPEESRKRDLALMGRVVGGDAAAFAELFDRCGPVVLGFLVRLLRSHPEGEEVLQEVFLQVWLRAGDYRSDLLPPCSWFLTLARNLAIDRLRTRISRGRREALYGSGAADTLPIGTSRLEEQEKQRSLMSALDHLPADRRAYLDLSFFQGLSHTQIADHLRAPLGTVKSRIRAALFDLKGELAEPAV